MQSKQRRESIKRLATGALLGAVGVSAVMRKALANGSRPLAPGVYKVSGPATLNGQPAQPGMHVGSGDTLITGSGGQIIYVIGQDAFLQRENSTVSFSGTTAEVVRIVSGKILSVFGKGHKTLETATATIGIRGTGCYIESEATRVYFCLCYGIADLTPAADPTHTERIETRHHDHPVYIYHDATMPSMVDASVINHTDAELELLESLVGRSPPFRASAYRY